MSIEKGKKRLARIIREVHARAVNDKKITSSEIAASNNPSDYVGKVFACVSAYAQIEVKGSTMVGKRGYERDVNTQTQRSAIQNHAALTFGATGTLRCVIYANRKKGERRKRGEAAGRSEH